MIDGLLDRLASVRRPFTDVLELGCFDRGIPMQAGTTVTRADPGQKFAALNGGSQVDEDCLPFAPGSFDLVVSAGVLDTVGDLPGALAQIKTSLRPDGLFLSAFTGGATLSTLRQVLRDAEAEQPVARIHPQIDVRSAGDLLVRAGFALPVAVTETLTVRYGDIFRLLSDLRGMAATNIMPARRPLRRDTLARAARLFAERADPDGRTPERFDIVYLTGWAPAPSQPKPAKRGSGTASLAQLLDRQA